MSSRTIFDSVKRATVAIAVSHDKPSHPFSIAGSGFCIDPRGIVVTCRHVMDAFMEESMKDSVANIPKEEKGKNIQKFPVVIKENPQALLYGPVLDDDTMQVSIVPIAHSVVQTDNDLAMVRLSKHAAFPDGYPSLQIKDYSDVFEGMEIGVCGFPLGDQLQHKLGTVSSSFTRGILSSIIPVSGVSSQYLKGFQLDIVATHGNSGGPVFEWSTGQVFGVLTEGIAFNTGGGLVKAEPVYPLLDRNSLDEFADSTLEKLEENWGAP